MPLSAVQQLVKLRSCFKHEGHTLIDIGQIGGGVVAELNGAAIVEGTALACEGQLNGLSYAGGYAGYVVYVPPARSQLYKP